MFTSRRNQDLRRADFDASGCPGIVLVTVGRTYPIPPGETWMLVMSSLYAPELPVGSFAAIANAIASCDATSAASNLSPFVRLFFFGASTATIP